MQVALRRNGQVTLGLALVLALLAAAPAHADTLTLTWDAVQQPVAGYFVYSGTQSGSLSQRYDAGNSTSFMLSTAAAGQRYCFAVSAYFSPTLEGPRSTEVCGYSNEFPTLVNPGSQSSTVGQAASLQLVGNDPDGQPVSYSATGLPPGLTIMSGTGFISGTATTAGSYPVVATVFDGVLTSAPQSFTWSVAAAAASDTTAPSVSITGPTTASTYQSSSLTLTISGTAADNVGVTQVSWANDRGGSGIATGTTNWTVASVGLQVGANVITVTSRDAAGNRGTDVLTVTYTAPDSTPPAVSIATPTTSSTLTTTSATIALGGTASDNVGVAQVSWATDRGAAGTASGTSNWSVGSVALQSGANIITVTARDAAGNQGTDVLTVTYSSPDTVPPTITIVGPTTASSYSTTSSVLTLGGTAADDRGVTAVTWSNDRGGSGFSSGTTNWSVPSVTLVGGTNVITVRAQDAAGNQGTDRLTVTYSAPAPESEPAPSPSIVLTGSFYASGKWSKVFLRWTIVKGRYVDVYRDNVNVTRTANDGSHADAPRGEGPFSYRVCITGTSTCSNTVLVSK